MSCYFLVFWQITLYKRTYTRDLSRWHVLKEKIRLLSYETSFKAEIWSVVNAWCCDKRGRVRKINLWLFNWLCDRYNRWKMNAVLKQCHAFPCQYLINIRLHKKKRTRERGNQLSARMLLRKFRTIDFYIFFPATSELDAMCVRGFLQQCNANPNVDEQITLSLL